MPDSASLVSINDDTAATKLPPIESTVAFALTAGDAPVPSCSVRISVPSTSSARILIHDYSPPAYVRDTTIRLDEAGIGQFVIRPGDETSVQLTITHADDGDCGSFSVTLDLSVAVPDRATLVSIDGDTAATELSPAGSTVAFALTAGDEPVPSCSVRISVPSTSSARILIHDYSPPAYVRDTTIRLDEAGIGQFVIRPGDETSVQLTITHADDGDCGSFSVTLDLGVAAAIPYRATWVTADIVPSGERSVVGFQLTAAGRPVPSCRVRVSVPSTSSARLAYELLFSPAPPPQPTFVVSLDDAGVGRFAIYPGTETSVQLTITNVDCNGGESFSTTLGLGVANK